MNKVQRVSFLIVAIVLTLFVGISVAGKSDGKPSECKTVYTCPCGEMCKCSAMSVEPGKCPCGKEMMQNQVIKQDKDNLYVCDCGPDCNCTAEAADGNKCSCGKELKAVPKADKAGCACCQKNKM